ncbi:MAG: hypothetical protein QI199_01420, partial [Candidatus Korarchaeota archaeon]|nr:hypothetical protein [Candidatus Korarchaeota archaeon]
LYTLSNLSRSERIAAVMTIGDVGFLERDTSSFNYLRWFMGPIREYPSITVLNLSSPPVLNSSLAVVLPADTYLRRRALVAYELLRPSLPVHTIYMSDDPLAPPGLYIGPPSPEVRVDEELPSSPYDLRWLYIWGNFSEGSALKVTGKRGEAISSFQLDQGNYTVRACGRMLGYVALIYDFVNFGEYRIFQVYLDRGFGIHRVVSGGKVLSGKPFKVPVKPTDECVNITLSLHGGNLTAYVNGRAQRLPPVEKLGVLGLETGNFTGNLSGRVEGAHSLRWSPPDGSTLVSVLGGSGDLDMSEWVDRGLRNLSDTKRTFDPPKLELKAGRWEMPPVKAVITGFNATGTVKVRGRLIWYSEGGRRIYINSSIVEVRASSVRFRGGQGFYIDLDLEGAEGVDEVMGGGNITVRFRLPVTVEAEGSIALIRYHRFSRYIPRTSEVRTSRAKFTIVIADNAQLISDLDVPREDLSPSRILYKSFDETKYLPEALLFFLISFAALYYLDKRYWWEPSRTPASVRRGRRKGRGR